MAPGAYDLRLTTPLIIVQRYSYGPVQQFLQRASVLLKILAVAVLLSYIAPVGSELPAPYDKLSSLIGWTYFVMWTISFYPQLFTNYRRKSVEGLSLDFLALNVAGFGCYTIFNLGLVFIPQVKHEYQQRFGRVGVPVELNDVFFAGHALLLSLVMAIQTCLYERGSQRVHTSTWLGLSISLAAGAAIAVQIQLYGEAAAPYTWLDLCYYCSFVKMGVTLVKFVPQVQMNCSRRSTDGWSVDNVLLDLGGGALSIGQLIMSCITLGEWSLLTGNPIKLGLGLTSVGFDLLFIMQHMVFAGNPATTPARIDASWFGDVSVGPQGCGTYGCICPCPRCRYPASDYAAITVAGQSPAVAHSPMFAAQQFFPFRMRCMCHHGAADGFTPLAVQFYRGAQTGSLSNLYRALSAQAVPEGYDFTI